MNAELNEDTTDQMSARSLLSVYREKQTYKNIIFLLSLLIIDIFLFTYVVTGISLSIGLAVTVIGIVVAFAFLRSIPYIMNAYSKYTTVMTGMQVIGIGTPITEGNLFGKTLSLLKNKKITKSMVFMIFGLFLSIFIFTLVMTVLSISIGLISAITYPLVKYILGLSDIDISLGVNITWFEYDFPVWSEYVLSIGIFIIGFIMLTFALNLINALVQSYVDMINSMFD